MTASLMRSGRILLCVLLTAGIAYTLAQLVSLALFGPGVTPPVGSPGRVATGAAEPSLADIDSIVAADLFGRDSTTLTDPEPETLPVTNLGLRLWGVAKGARPSAIISVGRNPMEVFYEGDLLLPGVHLSAVLSDRVLLDRGGVLEALYFAPATENGGTSRVQVRDLPVREGSIPASKGANLVVQSGVAPSVSRDLRSRVSRLILAAKREEELRAADLARIIGFMPYGLHRGDQILSYAGVGIADLDEDPTALIEKFSGKPFLGGGIWVRRGDREIEIDLATGQFIRSR